jgi:hypothetical protein
VGTRKEEEIKGRGNKIKGGTQRDREQIKERNKGNKKLGKNEYPTNRKSTE